MPRNEKPENLKTSLRSISLPLSFESYALSYGDKSGVGFSGGMQLLIAERVLGVSYAEICDWYKKTEDIRLHRDPLSKETIRMARWVLESTIQKEWISGAGDKAIVEVVWGLTGAITLCEIDLTRPGFRHVIYDKVVTSVGEEYRLCCGDRELKGALPEEIMPDITAALAKNNVQMGRLDTHLPLSMDLLKRRLITAWLKGAAVRDTLNIGGN